MTYTYLDIAKMIDHSLLNPTLTTDELEAGCSLARHYDVASVCILPYALPGCAAALLGAMSKPARRSAFRMAGTRRKLNSPSAAGV